MLESAGLECSQGKTTWDEICNIQINGRQIRNQVRVLKIMHDKSISTDDIKDSLEYTAK